MPTFTRTAHNVVDRTGERYGRLVVVERAGRRGTAATWLCACDCGNQKIIASGSLRSGYARSCGCSRRSGPGSRPSYRTQVPPGQSARKTVIKGYRLSAKYRGYEWGLSDTEFDALTSSSCVYCGVAPSTVSQPSRNGSFIYNGLDRIDNTRGYVADNVVTCCCKCNHAKKDMSQGEFLEWLDRLVAHRTAAAQPKGSLNELV